MNSSSIDLQFDIFGFSTMAFKRPNKDTSENQFFVILKMKSYDVFDSRNGFSDLENHTKDTKQTFLAAFYPFWRNLVKIGPNLDQFDHFLNLSELTQTSVYYMVFWVAESEYEVTFHVELQGKKLRFLKAEIFLIVSAS